MPLRERRAELCGDLAHAKPASAVWVRAETWFDHDIVISFIDFFSSRVTSHLQLAWLISSPSKRAVSAAGIRQSIIRVCAISAVVDLLQLRHTEAVPSEQLRNCGMQHVYAYLT
jgi:hypothetical protein